MSGSKGAGGSQTVNTDPWIGAQSFISDVLYGGKNQFDNGAGFYTPRNANQVQGDTSALNYASGKLPSMIDPYQNWSQTMLERPGVNDNPFGINPALQQNMNLFSGNSGATGQGIDANPYNVNSTLQSMMNAPNNISSNPALEQYAQAATRPLQQQLDLQTMPGIRSMFGGAQPGGGSRQGVAEGVAQGLTNQGIGDTRANIYNNAYNQSLGQQQAGVNAATQNYGIGAQRQTDALGLANNAYNSGLDAQGRALALYPQALNAGLMPSNIYSQIGAGQQADQNAQQTDPYKKLGAYADIVNGAPQGSRQTTSSGGGSTAMNALGGGVLGQGLGSMLLPGMGALSGGGVGALLGLLGGLFG